MFLRRAFFDNTSLLREQVLKTPYPAPWANAICERFLGSVRRACLDHVLIVSEKQVHRILLAYVAYFNRARPHQAGCHGILGIFCAGRMQQAG